MLCQDHQYNDSVYDFNDDLSDMSSVSEQPQGLFKAAAGGGGVGPNIASRN